MNINTRIMNWVGDRLLESDLPFIAQATIAGAVGGAIVGAEIGILTVGAVYLCTKIFPNPNMEVEVCKDSVANFNDAGSEITDDQHLNDIAKIGEVLEDVPVQ
ncbi:hypothetical protein phytr_10890 [Candidatus Phycorickettsia trachydisci]|uniref:Uncharacterized protein n=1 Tax=Candidatus Phycorickettsia trachydisci TaxID=2115978 RepID=A0A2P1P9U6_9RICK|nr:hypothetical protein [Candidatus Phycorickettsia trachydisci]AVP88016.1 hypothetical protein phytr_10890 [Candidatus Phycorickettsia trachydisci]